MNYRKTKINGALDYIEKARLYIATNQPNLANQVLGYALEDLRFALDVGPSEKAIEEVSAGQRAETLNDRLRKENIQLREYINAKFTWLPFPRDDGSHG